MAFFKYLGEAVVDRPYVKSYGTVDLIRVRQGNGLPPLELHPRDPVTGWEPGETLDIDITDATALRILRADVRFEEVLDTTT